MMKGFTKDGKFRPTGRTKSSLSKKDVKKKVEPLPPMGTFEDAFKKAYDNSKKRSKSQWDKDSDEISRIQFHTDHDQKTKNKMISKIEEKMGKEEQLELDGKGTGYYEDKERHEETLDEPKMTFKEFVDSGSYLEDEVRERAEEGSPHFFDADTMRFFSSRISELMWQKGGSHDSSYKTKDIYFITSESDKGSVQHAGSVRAFTVRKVDADGDIDTVSDFQEFATLNDARHEIQDILEGND